MPTVLTSEVSSIFNERTQSKLPPLKRKNNTVSIVIMIAVLLLVAIGAIRLFAAKPEVKTTVTVVGAGVDLAPGSRIHFSSLHYIEIPQKYVTSKMMVSNEQLVGAVLKHYVPQGEPITADDVFTGRNSLSNNIETHERAVTLRLEPEALVDNELAPDDMVDVLATSNKDNKHYTKTICQNARVVLSMPREALESRTLKVTDGHRVTLAAGPREAELIAHAAETAKIRLVLRSRLSRKTMKLNGVADDDLLPPQAFTAVQPPVVQQNLPPITPPSIESLPDAANGLTPPEPPMAGSLPPPVKWVVEMFTGSRKELYELPTHN